MTIFSKSTVTLLAAIAHVIHTRRHDCLITGCVFLMSCAWYRLCCCCCCWRSDCTTVVYSVWTNGVDPLEAATAGFTSSLSRLLASDWLLKNQSEIMIESGQTVWSNRRARSSSQIQSLNAFLVMTGSRSCRRRRGLTSKHKSTLIDSSLVTYVVMSSTVQVVDAKNRLLSDWFRSNHFTCWNSRSTKNGWCATRGSCSSSSILNDTIRRLWTPTVPRSFFPPWHLCVCPLIGHSIALFILFCW